MKGTKKEVGKPVVAVVLTIVVIAIGWFGWNFFETPENKGLNEEAIFRDAEKQAKANNVDIRTLPQWGALYYKYHPEEKPPADGGAPTMAAPPVAGAEANALPQQPAPPPPGIATQ